MNYYEIEVNGIVLDLYPNTVIAQTLKAIELGDLTTRKFNFTNTIRLPATPTNDLALGLSSKLNSDSTKPYTKLSAKIKTNGIETVPNGIMYIKSTNGDYSVYIISGAKSFFDVVGDKTLNDLSGFTFKSTTNDLASYRNTTQNVLYPVCITGTIETPKVTILPFIYYHSLIKKMFSDAGYTYSGNVFSNTKFLKKTVNAFGNPKGYASSFVEERKASGYVTTPQAFVVTNNGSSQTVAFLGSNNPGSSIAFWDTTDSRYKANDTSVAANALLYSCNVRVTINITVQAGTTINLVLRDQNGNTVDNIATNVGSGTYTYDFVKKNITPTGWLTETPIAKNGLTFGIRVAALYNSPAGGAGLTSNVTINSGSIDIIPLEIPLSVSSGLGVDSYIYYAKLLPEIKQIDVLRDFAVRYGLLFDEVDGNVECKYIDDVINDNEQADWTNKRNGTPFDPITFSAGIYGQRNNFRYQNTDDKVSADLGLGYFNIANENIPLVQDIFTSVFSNVGSAIASNITAAYFPTDENFFGVYPKIYSETTGVGLLLTRSKYALEPSVMYQNSTSYSDYLVVYFQDPNQSDSMILQTYIDAHYPRLISILQKSKRAVRYYALTETDIHAFTFLKPVFDEDTKFMVSTISEYQAGELTRVEIIKL